MDCMREKYGDEGVKRLLELSGSKRTPEYLCDLGNWISYDEGIAILEAGREISGEEDFAFRLGKEAGERLAGSPVAALLRSLGAPEEVYRQLVSTAEKFNTVTVQSVDEVRPGFARLKVGPREGFPRSRVHCDHTRGLFTCTPVLFGLAPATIEHKECAADGKVDACTYEITWDPAKPQNNDVEDVRVAALQIQLDAATQRLQGVFATATDLIAAEDIDVTLARITDRAALEVRAPQHVLAVRATDGGRLHIHSRGLEDDEAKEIADRLLADDAADLPDAWIVAEVGSQRHHYGRLAAIYRSASSILNEERELLDVYSRYAAAALDNATSLSEARRRHAEANALLELARTLASTSSRAETALRLGAAVPTVIDCDRADLLAWDDSQREFVSDADVQFTDVEAVQMRVDPQAVQPLAGRLSKSGSKSIFIGSDATDQLERQILFDLGAVSAALVPIRSGDRFLGALVLWVDNDAERLRPSPELASLLSGVAAHATSALENAILLDAITYQARHDGLTGLTNRAFFVELLKRVASEARARERSFSLFYIDIDVFKQINDELGHDVGDDLLRQVADRLRACVRNDDLVARLGGDEYGVIVEEVDAESAEIVGRRLSEAFETPFKIGVHEIDVKASIGRSDWSGSDDELEAMVRRADTEMYKVKRVHHARAAAPGAGSRPIAA
ncbi:MAG: GGDEF domain-containing protein [Actinobacteria bacterium]|nr:GGDEF domain-containing protein [Actinomycetota bacterium]